MVDKDAKARGWSAGDKRPHVEDQEAGHGAPRLDGTPIALWSACGRIMLPNALATHDTLRY